MVEALTKVFAVNAEVAKKSMRKWMSDQHNTLRM